MMGKCQTYRSQLGSTVTGQIWDNVLIFMKINNDGSGLKSLSKRGI